MATIWFIILGIATFICGLYFTFGGYDDLNIQLGCLMVVISVLCFLIASAIGIYDLNHPTALDVYRNKTTLEITYKDSVSIDSVVVFKNK